MRHFYPLALISIALVATAVVATAATPRVDVSELKAGQTGYGLSVFSGSRPDTFSVTILGVQRGARPGGDIILVELAGQDLETTAVAQGMSGSPVYLDDGRLVGAVAFGWAGALRPIAGLTPAVDLDLARDRRDAAPRAETGPSGDDPRALLGQPASGELARRLLPGVAHDAHLQLAGLDDPWPDPETLARDLLPAPPATATSGLAPLPLGLFVVPTGAAMASSAAAAPLEPGSACAVALVSGDAQLGAIGTVSLVEGQRLVSMAHPFLQLGPVDLPLATAEIISMFPSRSMSFKLGTAGPVVGRVTHDLRGGLAGDIGQIAPTTRVQVQTVRPDGESRYAFDVARHGTLTPALVYWCLYNALLAEGDDRSQQLVAYSIGIELAAESGAPLAPIRLEGMTGGPQGVAALASDWQAPLRMLLGNRHRPVTIEQVTARLEVQRPLEVLTVTGLRAPARIVPGEPFVVEVLLAELHGPTRRERFTLQAPAVLPDRPLRLGVGSAREFFQFDTLRASGLFQDRSLPVTIELLNRPRSLDELVVALVSPQSGFTSGGRELSDLPGSVRATLAQSPPQTVEPTMASYLARASRRLGAVIVGNAVQDLTAVAGSEPHPEGDRP